MIMFSVQCSLYITCHVEHGVDCWGEHKLLISLSLTLWEEFDPVSTLCDKRYCDFHPENHSSVCHSQDHGGFQCDYNKCKYNLDKIVTFSVNTLSVNGISIQ